MTRGGGGSSKDKGGRGGRGRPSGPVPRDVSVSKKLSWLLRHGAEKEGLVLGEGGYAALADVVGLALLVNNSHTFLGKNDWIKVTG